MDPDFIWVVLSQHLDMGCTVPTPGLSQLSKNMRVVLSQHLDYLNYLKIWHKFSGMTQVLQSQPATALPYVGHLGPVRGWLPLASMPLINQRGQYKSDSIIADAVGSTLQCIFNTSHPSNLIIDGKNVKKYQRHICGWPKRGLHSLPCPWLKLCVC